MPLSRICSSPIVSSYDPQSESGTERDAADEPCELRQLSDTGIDLRAFKGPPMASNSERTNLSPRALPKMRVLAVFPSLTEDWTILERLAGETNLSILIDHTVKPSFNTTAGYRLTRSDGADLPAAFNGELRAVRPNFYCGLKISRPSEVGVAGRC